MRNLIVDAGPLISLFDKDDKYHTIILNFIKDFNGNLITSWPVITEVTHLLSFNVNAQINFLEWLKREAINIFNLEYEHLERIIQLTKKYFDVPMDLAYSSLIIISELTGIKDIASIDSDYYIYRTKSKKALNNVLSSLL